LVASDLTGLPGVRLRTGTNLDLVRVLKHPAGTFIRKYSMLKLSKFAGIGSRNQASVSHQCDFLVTADVVPILQPHTVLLSRARFSGVHSLLWSLTIRSTSPVGVFSCCSPGGGYFNGPREGLSKLVLEIEEAIRDSRRVRRPHRNVHW